MTNLIFNMKFQITSEDHLPKMVCVDCSMKLDLSSDFFDNCSRAQRLLQIALETHKATTEDAVGDIGKNIAFYYIKCLP